VQKLPRAGVTLVVAEPIAEPALLEVVASADDVEQHAALREPLQRRRLLSRQRRRHQTRPERDKELQPLGLS
jgi:hypothetical protein